MTHMLKKGLLFAGLTAIISGFSIFYNKMVIVKGIDPLVFNILKNGGVGIILTLTLVSTGKFLSLRTLTIKQWRNLLLIAIVGGSIPFLLYFEGLRTIPATSANMIHKTMFLWVAAMALPFLRERLSLVQVIGYVIVAWSNLFLGGFSGFSGNSAELMILAATLLWSAENIFAKVMLKNLDSTVVAWARMAGGALVLLGIAAFQQKLPLLFTVSPDTLIATGGSIAFLTAYVLTWYKALKLAPATLVTSVLIFATPVTNLLSAAFLTHTLPQPQLINAVGTIVGLLLIAIMTRKKTPEHVVTPV